MNCICRWLEHLRRKDRAQGINPFPRGRLLWLCCRRDFDFTQATALRCLVHCLPRQIVKSQPSRCSGLNSVHTSSLSRCNKSSHALARTASSSQKCLYIAFCLALNAGIRVRDLPGAGLAVVFENAVFDGGVILFAGVVHAEAIFRCSICGSHGESNGIGLAVGGKLWALPGIAQVAKFLQLGLSGGGLDTACRALSGKSGSQGQPLRKSPGDVEILFGREEIRAGHSMPILVRITPNVLNFFHA